VACPETRDHHVFTGFSISPDHLEYRVIPAPGTSADVGEQQKPLPEQPSGVAAIHQRWYTQQPTRQRTDFVRDRRTILP
jgi:hypothetical protein